MAELKKPPSEAWANAYYEGDGLGANIRMLVSPRAGVAATWHGCLGLYGANEGQVRVGSDGYLHFAYNLPNQQRFGGFPDTAVPVRWGDRNYLVPPERLGDFVNAVNQGTEPRAMAQGMFLLASGDQRKHVKGLPELPPGYARRIRTAAVTAKILSVVILSDKPTTPAPMCERTYQLELAVSGAGPLQVGDELASKWPFDSYEILRITNVTSPHPMGTVTVLEGDCGKPDVMVDRQWVFASSGYDPIAANRHVDEERASRGAHDLEPDGP